jgi:signal transduction histidine kinase
MLMRRFYLRIYAALFASLVVFAVLAGMTAGLLRLFDDRPARSSWPEATAEIAERLLPPGRDAASLGAELAFWSERSGFDLALLSPAGDVIARAGDAHDIASAVLSHERHGRVWRAPGGVFGLTLKDGRRLIAVPREGRFGLVHGLRFPAALFGLALAIMIGFYPLIRGLTRRLERLEAGVAKFGEGDLAARVPVNGKDEIARLASTFNLSADRIESLMNAHKLLLAHASHELRSPLSRLRMAIERLQGNPADRAAQSEAARNIGELDTLVEEILLASRLQAAEAPLVKEPIDIAGLLAEECAAFGAEATVAGERAAPMVEGDARLLRRLFRNILQNAAVHGGPETPEATISATDNEVRVSICDRGPGIPGGDREKIFQPFYQSASRASRGGAGLGLTLVRQISERHGGNVRCLPRAGGGACFEVRLPLVIGGWSNDG